MFITAQNPLVNESVANLGISGVYTGTARQSNLGGSSYTSVAIFNNFNVQVISDQASAANVLQIQGSQDTAFTIPRVVAQSAVVASTPITLSVPVTYPFYRVVLTNGAVATTSLSIVSSFTL